MKFIDYYEVLGVSKTANGKELKTAYRKLARKFHPDLQKGDGKKAAEEKFKLINEAYEVLGDTEKRAKYDRLGGNWKNGQEFNPSPDRGHPSNSANDMDGFGFSDFFSNMFGQEFSKQRQNGFSGGYQYESRSRASQGEDIEAEIRLTIEELLIGTKKDLRLAKPHICSACTGRRFSENGICLVCRGTGVYEKNEMVTVTIPPMTHDGMILRLKGLGGKGIAGGTSGDLYLKIQSLPHEKWRITNQIDLETDLAVYPEQAVLGDRVLVLTPHGSMEVKINPETHSGQRLRLKGLGFKGRNGIQGDIYITIRIDLHRQQTAEEIQLYEQIAALRKV